MNLGALGVTYEPFALCLVFKTEPDLNHYSHSCFQW